MNHQDFQKVFNSSGSLTVKVRGTCSQHPVWRYGGRTLSHQLFVRSGATIPAERYLFGFLFIINIISLI